MKDSCNRKTRLLRYLKTDFFTEIAAAAMMALGVRVFAAPNFIVGGGVSGIASVLFTVFGWPIGTLSFLMNVPLLLLGWRGLGRDFILATLRIVLYDAIMTDGIFAFVAPYRGETLLAALFGGVLVGAGLGLILMKGASTGGTDIIVKLIQKRRPHLSLGRIVLFTDMSVVLFASVVYRSIDAVLYGAIMIYAATVVIDRIIDRADMRKLTLVITGQGGTVAQTLLRQLDRGVTILSATGAFTGEERAVLLCVVETRQLFELKRLVAQSDPAAFVIVANAAEALGAGFKPIDRV